ncbi:Glycosyl transferase family 1 [Candidatus Magnetomoraceae bacterium gMMP-1]
MNHEMKIIQIHNYYQQSGGEDTVVAAERALLEEKGNIVIPYYKSNDIISFDIAGSPPISALKTLYSLFHVSAKAVWNWETYSDFRKLLHKEKPDVVHCHNTFPLISPSIYWACFKEMVPVIQTLHNYRLLCLNGYLSRTKDNNFICEKCLKKTFKFKGVAHGCYRNSRAGSFVVAVMLLVHRLMGTWSKKVTAYIALTEFQKQKMIEGGVPAEKIIIKPNFFQTPKNSEQAPDDLFAAKKNEKLQKKHPVTKDREFIMKKPYYLFVGRLSAEKGCDLLIRAWHSLVSGSHFSPSNFQLLIIGDGPERCSLEKLVKQLAADKQQPLPETSIHFLGRQPREITLAFMERSKFLVFPSLWHETFGLTVLEAGMQCVPALISAPTATSSMILNWTNGLLFNTGQVNDLADKMMWAFSHSKEIKQMGFNAKRDFEQKYSGKVNYNQLIAIYERVQITDESVETKRR